MSLASWRPQFSTYRGRACAFFFLWGGGGGRAGLAQCPGFDSRTRRHMWAEFVGSLLCSERFFSGNSGFPLSNSNFTNTPKRDLFEVNRLNTLSFLTEHDFSL